LTWLLLAVLGIIWAALLLPSRARSPKSSVEEFEQRMNMLAEANRAAPGRWVLMPRKGQRFMGPERGRARVRRRRRQVFMVLLEATGLTLIMGIFPPFRIMLGVTAVLAFILLAYMAALVKLRADELEKDRMERMARRAPARSSPGWYSPAFYDAQYEGGNGYGVAYASNGNGHGNGRRGLGPGAEWHETGVRVIDDDVHVIVYRSDEIDTRSLTAVSAE